MKEIFTSMRFAVCATLVAAMTAGAADASAELIDLGELENGVAKEFKVEGFPQMQAYYVVPEDGTVKQFFTGTRLFAYKTAEHLESSAINGNFSFMGDRQVVEYPDCKKGETIYLYNRFVDNSGWVMMLCGDVDLEVTRVTPSPEALFTLGGGYTVDFIFNSQIKCSAAYVQCGDNKIECSFNVSGAFVEVIVNYAVMDLYSKDLLKKDDKFKVVLEGVCESSNPENKFGDNGVVVVEYTAAGAPVTLVSTVNLPGSGQDNLLSYYLPDNPLSKLEFTFSGNINDAADKLPVGKFVYGDADDIEAGLYHEDVLAHVVGNKVIIDLSGVRRRPQDMTPALAEDKWPKTIYFSLHNVHGEDGQRLYSGTLASPTTLGYSFNLTVLDYEIVSEFTPNESSELKEGEEMEIFVMNGDKIAFDGVKFTYENEEGETSVVVPMAELSVSPDMMPEDISVKLKVPALPGIKEGSKVKVEFNNLASSDGLDHSSTLECEYSSYKADESSVEAVEIGENAVDVYNTVGALVAKGVRIAEISNLPSGIYIAGGKKIVVK